MLIDPIGKQVESHQERIKNLEAFMETMQSSNNGSLNSESYGENKNYEAEHIIADIETIKQELTERGNLYIRLCEELESDRLDNKLMKEELESEFNIIQKQFETFDKTTQETVSNQINENIDFFIENLKNDIKNLKNEAEQERETGEKFMKRKIDDIKTRFETEFEEIDDRLTKINRELSARQQNITEKFEIDLSEINSKLRKLESKQEETAATSKLLGATNDVSIFLDL